MKNSLVFFGFLPYYRSNRMMILMLRSLAAEKQSMDHCRSGCHFSNGAAVKHTKKGGTDSHVIIPSVPQLSWNQMVENCAVRQQPNKRIVKEVGSKWNFHLIAIIPFPTTRIAAVSLSDLEPL